MGLDKMVFLCPDSVEGIFTSVYQGWKWGASGREVEIRTEEVDSPELFCTYIEINPDPIMAQKVANTIKRKLGPNVFEAVYYVAASCHREKGTVIFQLLFQALKGGRNDRHIMEKLTDPYINLASRLRVKVWHELHRFYGFTRFSQVGEFLFAKIKPENDILFLLAPHFANRFPNENWAIYDEAREKVLVHPKGSRYFIRTGIQEAPYLREGLTEAGQYESLWKAFCTSISIEERRNHHLQQQFVPLKFRPNMTEFQDGG